MDLAKLKEPFPAEDIEWRIQQSGLKGDKPWAMVLAYVTNRAIQERLDEVCGPENWENEFIPAPDGGVLCGITIHIDNKKITKYDGAPNTDIESVKGGLSASMKRAGSMCGIGRYLYKLEVGWANISPNGKFRGSAKPKSGGNPVYFKWDPPKLPDWAVPKGPPPTTTNFKFLKVMKDLKIRITQADGNADMYYKKLGNEGFEKANLVIERSDQEKVHGILKEYTEEQEKAMTG